MLRKGVKQGQVKLETKPVDFNPNILIGVFIFFLFLIILFFTVPCFKDNNGKYVSGFSNIKNKISSKNDLKDLSIIMFVSSTCKHCKDMIDVLVKEDQLNNIMIIDTLKPEGREIAKQFGVVDKPLPYIISRKLNVATSGSKKSVNDLIIDLTVVNKEPKGQEQGQEQNDLSPEFIKEMDIVMLSREGCGFCSKAKKELVDNKLEDIIKVIDNSSKDGDSVNELLKDRNLRGVPVFYSYKTQKHVEGYKPIDVVIKELK